MFSEPIPLHAVKSTVNNGVGVSTPTTVLCMICKTHVAVLCVVCKTHVAVLCVVCKTHVTVLCVICSRVSVFPPLINSYFIVDTGLERNSNNHVYNYCHYVISHYRCSDSCEPIFILSGLNLI